MKEITRIHIAKVAYDIELDAKKDIEQYIGALERYADDPEILGDIEIRITELLAEQGVAAGGVIAASDVAAVREILGEPSDFAAEGASEATGAENEPVQEPRRVYRDEDEAIVGGVLAGFARFFGIDPLWARLIFIVLLFASFGTAIIIYLILWLIIPPARTAAERLHMTGQPVTLASIKSLAGNEEQRSNAARVTRQVLRALTGALLVAAAIGGLLAIIAVVFGIGWSEFTPLAEGWMYGSWWFMTAVGLFVLSGLLFSALCFLLASAVFRRQWTKRIGVAVVVIIATGLVVFASGVGMSMYGYASEQARIAELRKTTSADLPANFMDVQSLTLASEGGSGRLGYIEYIVSDSPRYELEALPGVKPLVEFAGGGSSATVRLTGADDNAVHPWGYASEPTLRIYGPALDNLEAASSQAVRYYNDARQEKLDVVVRDNSQFNLGGRYNEVSVKAESGALATLEDAAIGELRVDGGRVTAGVVRLLDVTQPDVCAGSSRGNFYQYVKVQAISGDTLTYNGSDQPAQTIENECGRVVVGDEFSVGSEW